MGRMLVGAIAVVALALVAAAPAQAARRNGTDNRALGNAAYQRLPRPPVALGCYRFEAQGWLRVRCARGAEVLRRVPHPELEDGILSQPTTFPPVTPSFTFGSVFLRFWQVGTETDSKAGANAYSVQNNVTFVGSNGQSDGVQFTEQTTASQLYVCVWQVDIKTKDYTPTCTKTAKGFPIAKGDVADVEGYVRAGDRLATVASVPGTAKVFSIVVKDTYGLLGRWTNISGSVLGRGAGSLATFSSAEVQTLVDASTCVGPPGSVGCPQSPVLMGHAVPSYSGATEETNNLVPVIGLAPTHLPPLMQLVVDQADIEYVSTTSGGCPGTAQPPFCGLPIPNG